MGRVAARFCALVKGPLQALKAAVAEQDEAVNKWLGVVTYQRKLHAWVNPRSASADLLRLCGSIERDLRED